MATKKSSLWLGGLDFLGRYGLVFPTDTWSRAETWSRADTVAAGPSTAATIAIGSSGILGRIDTARDADWYRVSLTAGQTYVISELGAPTGSGTLADPNFIGVYNSAGQLIPGTGNDDAGGTLNSQVTFRPAASGTYFLAAGGYYDATGSYLLKITASAASSDLPASTLSTAMVAVNGTTSSRIDTSGDVDWIGVNLAAGHTYTVNELGAPTGNGTLADPYILGIYNATGAVIAGTADDDSGTGANAMVSFTAPATGKYFVAAGAYGSNLGTYAVSVQETTDTHAPVRLSTSPADNAVGVGVAQNLTLTFDEAVTRGTGNFVLHNGSQVTNISVNDATQVSISGDTVTINPTADLLASTGYYVTYAAGVVDDLAHNHAAALSTTTGWNFTTAAPGTTATDIWTIIVYMAADNNLESFALSDLNEMEMVNLPSNVNVVVMADRAVGYDAGSGNWTDAHRGQILYDGTNTTVTSLSGAGTSIGEIDTGQGSNLTNLINWAAASNPAQHYGLVVWDHGGGLSGTCWDDSSNGDNLTLSEFRSAVDASNVDHFGFIGFDACLMGMTEQAFDLASLADVMVASQELEPGDGWDYDVFLNQLKANPSMTPEQLAASIVTSYAPQYAGQADITLAATRLAGMASLETSLDTFVARALALPASSADWTNMRTAAQHCREFPSGGGYDYADLGQFMGQVAGLVTDSTLRTAALNVETALNNAVFQTAGSVGEATGLSIYLPYGSTPVDSTYTQANDQFLAHVDWDNFLARL